MSNSKKIALIGDVHGRWNLLDVEFFNENAYGGVLFTGDLPIAAGAEKIAEHMAGLTVPAWLIPGNHDSVTLVQLLAEIRNQRFMIHWTARGQLKRYNNLLRSLGRVVAGGYSHHRLPVERAGKPLYLVMGRPFSMGGDVLGCAPFLRKKYHVHNKKQSTKLIVETVRQCDGPVLVLSHNGPAGLGDRATDIWGCDFRKEEGDFGDSDLARALSEIEVEHPGKVLGVVAGHMHHALKGEHKGRTRRWFLRDDNRFYLNGARVPRIRRLREGDNHIWHYFQELDFSDWEQGGDIQFYEVHFCPATGDIRRVKLQPEQVGNRG